jgi:alkylhydroperoxidase family enzyme
MYEIYTPESAPAGSKAALAAIRERVGFLPNLAATMGAAPVLAASFDAMQGLLRDTTLTGPEREVVGLTVSYANSCAPSMAIHSTFALKLGLAPEVVAALRDGMPVPDERLQALHELTLSLVQRRGYLDPAKLQAFEAAGYTTGQLFEVIAQVAYTSIANWVANITDPPLDEVFKPQYWSTSVL